MSGTMNISPVVSGIMSAVCDFRNESNRFIFKRITSRPDSVIFGAELENCALGLLDRLYTRQTNGVQFLDWFTAAVTGNPAEDVACVDCETPEYHWTRPKFPQ
jgi:hypothetical protein